MTPAQALLPTSLSIIRADVYYETIRQRIGLVIARHIAEHRAESNWFLDRQAPFLLALPVAEAHHHAECIEETNAA